MLKKKIIKVMWNELKHVSLCKEMKIRMSKTNYLKNSEIGILMRVDKSRLVTAKVVW